MFDIGWSELLVIAIVAIVVVGPKELPRVLRTFGTYAGKLKRTAAEFRRQFDEVMLESELEEARKSFERAAKQAEAELKLSDGPPVMLPKSQAPQPTAADPAPDPAPKRVAKAKAPSAKPAGAKRATPAKQTKAKAEPAP
jgi:sec-independent protein translocase protein TatB